MREATSISPVQSGTDIFPRTNRAILLGRRIPSGPKGLCGFRRCRFEAVGKQGKEVLVESAIDKVKKSGLAKGLQGLALELKGVLPAESKPPAGGIPAESVDLDEDTKASIRSAEIGLRKGDVPDWVRETNPNAAGFFNRFGARLIENAPDSIKNANDCVKAKYVYAMGLPILDKFYGFRQLDGSSVLGACNVLLSKRGMMRVAYAGVDYTYNLLGEKLSPGFKKITVSPQEILLRKKQGTCGEWGYSLKDIMDGAGVRSSVITALNKNHPTLNNHAATAVECQVAGGQTAQLVCDAWYLGHDNQRRDPAAYTRLTLFNYGHFDGAVDSQYNCMTIDRWKEQQRLASKELVINPDLNPDADPSIGFQTDRDKAISDLKQLLDRTLGRALDNGYTAGQYLAIAGKNFQGLFRGEENRVLAGLIRQKAKDCHDYRSNSFGCPPEDKAKLEKLASDIENARAGNQTK